MNIEHFEKIESYIPIDLLSIQGFLIATAVVMFFILFRYFLMVGTAYGIFWKTSFLKDKVQLLHDRNLPKDQIKLEISYSLLSSVIFAVSGVVMGLLWQGGYSQIYTKFDEFGFWYLPLSFLIYSLIHESYFYYTHVWMHRPKIYKRVHRIHHLSVKTSPWASFSFHPWEALVHASFLPVLVLFVPIHPVVIISYLTFMTVTAISNHLGVELIPFKVVKEQFISGEHHSTHHTKLNYNYGLYFTFLDKLSGTEYSIYGKRAKSKSNKLGEIV
jgi:sterol desaturase/sphingolipid hydroxylase (fatty acid hydroxylase superfamily)